LPPFVADLLGRPLSLMVTAGDPAKRGWELFNGKARCQLCHALTDNQPDTTLFMDNDFHNIGIGILGHHVAPSAQQAERELAQGRLEPIDTASITF
jgi:cytochrome c peroxidase